MPQEINQKKEFDSILNDYTKWQSIEIHYIKDFTKELSSPARNLWLGGCQQAVANANYQWLAGYAECEDINNLISPLNYLNRIQNGEGKKRRNAAVFIANCALAALYLKELSSGEEHKTKFIDCFRRAIFTWQKVKDLNYFDGKPISSEIIITPTPVDLDKFTGSWLDVTTKAFSDKNPDCEILPVEDLIYFFKGEEKGWGKDSITTAKFPTVDQKREQTEICQIEIERRENGTGRFYRDPIKMSFSIIDVDFQKSLQVASEYIKKNSSEWNDYDYRWRVSENNSTSIFNNSLMHQSVGLSAAIALNDAVRKIDLGENYVFSGKVKEDGNIGEVGELKNKITVAGKNNLTIFVPKANEDEEIIKEINSYVDKVRFVNSFTDVTETIRGEIQKRKEEEDKKKWRRRWGTLGIAAFFIVALFTAVFGVWGKYNADQKVEIAEEKEKVAKDETDKLKVLTSKLDEKNKELTETNGQLESAKNDLIKINGQLEDAKGKLEIANGKLDKKNKVLLTTNKELDVAKKDADKQRDIANQKTVLAVFSEQEAQKQRKRAEDLEKLTAANHQISVASQLGNLAYKSLYELDYTSAQTLFASSIAYDDLPLYRDGLFETSLKNPFPMRFVWSKKDQCDDINFAASTNYGNLYTFGGNCGYVGIYDFRNGKEIVSIPTDNLRIIGAAFGNKGKLIALNELNEEQNITQISIWDITSKRLITKTSPKRLDETQTPDPFIFLSGILTTTNDDNKFIVITPLNELEIRDFQTGQVQKNIKLPSNTSIYTTSISDDGFIAYAGFYGSYYVGKLNDNTTPPRWIGSVGSKASVYFDYQRRIVVVGESQIHWFDLQRSQLEKKVDVKDQLITASQISSNGKYLFTGDLNGRIDVWSTESQEIISRINSKIGPVISIKTSQDDRIIVTYKNGETHCWQFRQQSQAVETILADQGNNIYLDTDLFGYGSAKIFATDNGEDQIEIYDTTVRKVILSIGYEEGDTYVISPNGKYLAVAGIKTPLQLIDLETRQKLISPRLREIIDFQEAKSHSDNLDDTFSHRIKISSDGKYVALILPDNKIAIWQPQKNKINLLSNQEQETQNIVFSSSGDYFSLVTSKGLEIYNSFTLKPVSKINHGHLNDTLAFIPDVAFSRDEKIVATIIFPLGKLSSEVKFWNVETGKELFSINSSQEIISGIDFSPDSKYVALTSPFKGKTYFYRLEKLLKNEEEFLPGINSLIGQNGKIKFSENGKKLSIIGEDKITIFNFEQIEQLLLADSSLLIDNLAQQNGLFASNSSMPSARFNKDSLNQISANNRAKISFYSLDNVLKDPAFPNKLLYQDSRLFDFYRDNPPNLKNSTTCEAFIKPILNPFPVDYTDNIGTCRGYPIIDARILKNGKVASDFSHSENEWKLPREAHAGDFIVVLMYLTNGAANNLGPHLIARNIILDTKINIKRGNIHKIEAKFHGANVSPISDQIFIKTFENEYLEVVPSSGTVLDYTSNIVLRANQQIGNNSYSVGDLRPGFETDLFIQFIIEVKKK